MVQKRKIIGGIKRRTYRHKKIVAGNKCIFQPSTF